jgi:hypothetical protein
MTLQALDERIAAPFQECVNRMNPERRIMDELTPFLYMAYRWGYIDAVEEFHGKRLENI